jgi:predicted metalloendopeptidase
MQHSRRVVSFLALAAASLTMAADDGATTPKEISKTVTEAMDRTADPCQDFYQYACGGWIKNTPLPSDQARWTRSFSVIRESNRAFINDVLKGAAASPAEDPDGRKLGDFYGSCMDESTIDKAGAKPLDPLMKLVSSVEDPESLLVVSAKLQRMGVNALLGLGVFPDFKNPDLNIAWFFQGGLGMPDRDYYVSEDAKKKELIGEYEKYIARMFGLLGDDEKTAAKSAADVLAFETELAKASRPAQEMRDFERLYNKIDLEGLNKLTPGLPWTKFMEGIGYPGLHDISVATPEFFERVEDLAKETPKETLQTYLRWNVINGFANALSSDFVNASFEFYGKKLQGQQEIEPRWKRCVNATQAALGEVLGRVFVKARFAGDSKKVATEMIHDIEAAFEGSLPSLAWMDDTTRAGAKEKVATLINKIGYPDEWRDYSGLKLKRGDHFGNSLSSNEFEFDYQAGKAGNPVDRNDWGMAPQMVNAYYNPLWNEIVFPAGILQPPFFHREQPAAMNYGGIGGVIGHELTHGFDDQGRKFDPQGRLSEWWAPEVSGRFEERAQCVNDFYSGYEVADGANVNGQLTLGENIADIGGVKEAYTAYRSWESRHDLPPPPTVEGLTNEQLFFVGWGQVWCTVATEEYERMQVTTDPHSPGKFRVMGPLANNPDFARVFSCEKGTPMNPEKSCEVW